MARIAARRNPSKSAVRPRRDQMQTAHSQTSAVTPAPAYTSARAGLRCWTRAGRRVKPAARATERSMVRISIRINPFYIVVGAAQVQPAALPGNIISRIVECRAGQAPYRVARHTHYTPFRSALYSISALAWLMPLTSSRSEMLAALTAATVLKCASRAALVFSPTPGMAVSVAA